ncbi:MAG: aminotransferase class V-fold PLP-dependent enzyme [Desulfomicrobium sp.]|nr:aminotransferase class V-fold PLP-dependent enzyme [Pseudomonadota bacterium]MBV1711733.1 aminotransferase class V-fold PLP-dependent enzyme [Desulfomicrobium sp.]MBU4572679.1 aminotransferase class V-fold PLP-dependent enzyme [Pseudomonadota bacterium]MBU4593540.1 aminotransferase class V-fold PLP-dependent enzyme [Pseudomonadota bacterium]MBV1720462.1 aminotransferase class V-fold PLP-dependent enzyme [Desulfomicrobium sp.]
MEHRTVYFDNNATTPLHPGVKEALIEGLEIFGNPSSMHGFGREAREKIEEAREKVASFIGAEADEILFVGSGSEANNTVLSLLHCDSTRCFCALSGRSGLVTTVIEHPCVLNTARDLGRKNHAVTYLSVDKYGRIDLEELRRAVTDKVGMVSIMMANNEIGTIQDIKAAARIAHEGGALFHTDAVQAVGKIPVDVRDLDVDFLTISAHKLYGPKGIGALYVKKGSPYCPLILGGHQENGRRAGTENSLGIIGLGKAVELRALEMEEEEKRLLELKNILKDGIAKAIPDTLFMGHPEHCLPGTLSVSFVGAEGEAILLYLDLAGIAVSTGSACASGSLDPSHVIMATGVPVENAHGSVRISLGRENTLDDVQYMLHHLPPIIDRIRTMSTAYRRR